jgi:ABC-type glutathione transport system ATPase component
MNILEVKNLVKTFAIEQSLAQRLRALVKRSNPQEILALNNVSFTLKQGEILGILGESGSGKSTLAKILMGIYSANSGSATLNGQDLLHTKAKNRLELLKKIQMIFQDPFSSLNPRMTVKQILLEPIKIHKIQIQEPLNTFLGKRLAEVGLDPSALKAYPSEFSGGQRQRIGICRALMLEPEVIIADEAVSALDVSVQAQILELLLELKEKRKLSIIFISHDVAVVKQLADRIILLYKGELVEEIRAEDLLENPKHEYTKRLLKSALYLRENQ